MYKVIVRIVVCSLMGCLGVVAAAPSQGAGVPSGYRELLSRNNSMLLLIDLQPQFALATRTIGKDDLTSNAVGIAKVAKLFEVPTILSSNRASTYGGPFFAEITKALPKLAVHDRTVINAFDDADVAKAIREAGRKKRIIGGLWTDNCVMLPALTALKQGYDVYVLADVSGDVDVQSHQLAISRLVHAGAIPVTWLAVMLEWQWDWADTTTAGEVGALFSESMAARKP